MSPSPHLERASVAFTSSPGVRQRLLVADARTLDDLSKRVEHLAGHADRLEKVALARLKIWINLYTLALIAACHMFRND